MSINNPLRRKVANIGDISPQKAGEIIALVREHDKGRPVLIDNEPLARYVREREARADERQRCIDAVQSVPTGYKLFKDEWTTRDAAAYQNDVIAAIKG